MFQIRDARPALGHPAEQTLMRNIVRRYGFIALLLHNPLYRWAAGIRPGAVLNEIASIIGLRFVF